MRTYRRWFLTGAILLLLPLVIVNYARSNGDGDETKIRWDIISVNFATGTLSVGGIASARANDNSKLTLTGSGTFEPNDPEEVTGGGASATPNSNGGNTRGGTYWGKELATVGLVPPPPPP